jgi:hypothetical protein
MVKTRFVAAALVSLSSAALAQDRTGPPTGFGPFRFGMTLAEAKVAAGPDATVHHTGILIYPTMIGERPFTASARFSGPGGMLVSVELSLDDTARLKTATACAGEMKDIKNAISAKYGEPTNEKTKDFPTTKTKQWDVFYAFPNGTQIQVGRSFGEKLLSPPCAIWVVYKAAVVRPKGSF